MLLGLLSLPGAAEELAEAEVAAGDERAQAQRFSQGQCGAVASLRGLGFEVLAARGGAEQAVRPGLEPRFTPRPGEVQSPRGAFARIDSTSPACQ